MDEELYQVLLSHKLVAPSTVSGWRKGKRHPKWVTHIKGLYEELEDATTQIQSRDDYIARLERALLKATV